MKRLGMFIVAVSLLGGAVSAAEPATDKYFKQMNDSREQWARHVDAKIEAKKEDERLRQITLADKRSRVIEKKTLEKEFRRELVLQKSMSKWPVNDALAWAAVYQRRDMPMSAELLSYVKNYTGPQKRYLYSRGLGHLHNPPPLPEPAPHSRGLVHYPLDSGYGNRSLFSSASGRRTVSVNGSRVGEMDISGDRTDFWFKNGMKGYSETSPGGRTTIYIRGGGRMTID